MNLPKALDPHSIPKHIHDAVQRCPNVDSRWQVRSKRSRATPSQDTAQAKSISPFIHVTLRVRNVNGSS